MSNFRNHPSPLEGEGAPKGRMRGWFNESYSPFSLAAATPSSVASRHLLPRGEKGRKAIHG
jgi:hypothetical protein